MRSRRFIVYRKCGLRVCNGQRKLFQESQIVRACGECTDVLRILGKKFINCTESAKYLFTDVFIRNAREFIAYCNFAASSGRPVSSSASAVWMRARIDAG